MCPHPLNMLNITFKQPLCPRYHSIALVTLNRTMRKSEEKRVCVDYDLMGGVCATYCKLELNIYVI